MVILNPVASMLVNMYLCLVPVKMIYDEIIIFRDNIMLILSVDFCNGVLYNEVFWIVVKIISNNMPQPTSL